MTPLLQKPDQTQLQKFALMKVHNNVKLQTGLNHTNQNIISADLHHPPA